MGDRGDIPCLSQELRFFGIKGVPAWRILVAMLRVKELRVPLIEVFEFPCLRNIGEVQKVQQLTRLLLDRVEIDAELLRDGILRTCIVKQFFFWHLLGLLIGFI